MTYKNCLENLALIASCNKQFFNLTIYKISSFSPAQLRWGHEMYKSQSERESLSSTRSAVSSQTGKILSRSCAPRLDQTNWYLQCCLSQRKIQRCRTTGIFIKEIIFNECHIITIINKYTLDL